MLTATEKEYCQELLAVARREGYQYYLVHTITESGENSDFCVYLSDNPIVCNTPYSFYVPAGRRITVDSSQSYNSYSGDRIAGESYSGGTVTLNGWEFAYSNGTLEGGTLLPDLNIRGETNENLKAVGLVVTVVLLLLVFWRLLRS